MIIRVDSVSDPRLDDYRNVPDPELLRARGVFVAEGRLVVRRLLQSSRFRTRSVLVTPPAYEALEDVLRASGDVPVFVVTQEAMNGITGFNIHRGCLAIGERPAPQAWSRTIENASLVVILERVANADNVGSIFRSAAAFGADAVLLGPACADPLYRKAVRTSMAAALRVPFAHMTAWPEDLHRVRAAGFSVIALTPLCNAVPLRDLVPAPPIALMVGHEGEGLSADARAAADVSVRIPIDPGVDSLNVSAALSIALYELRRGILRFEF